jgi:hypothetical protein
MIRSQCRVRYKSDELQAWIRMCNPMIKVVIHPLADHASIRTCVLNHRSIVRDEVIGLEGVVSRAECSGV